MYPLSLTIEIGGRNSCNSRGGTTKLKVRAGRVAKPVVWNNPLWNKRLAQRKERAEPSLPPLQERETIHHFPSGLDQVYRNRISSSWANTPSVPYQCAFPSIALVEHLYFSSSLSCLGSLETICALVTPLVKVENGNCGMPC